MKIAIVSDIHGNLAALDAVRRDIARRGVDSVVNLGDSVSGPLLPRETAQFLMAEGWRSIAGNHERQLLTQGPGRWGASDAYAHAQLGTAELAWLAAQAPTHRLSDEVLLCHGTPVNDAHYFLESIDGEAMRAASAAEIDARRGGEGAPVILCGHTHVARSVRTSSGQLLVNPGSVGLPAYDDSHGGYHRIETGSPDARYAIVEETASGWSACLLTVPYDHRSMAALARANHRLEWEYALMTGYMPRGE
jgi:putative phosphoesterase